MARSAEVLILISLESSTKGKLKIIFFDVSNAFDACSLLLANLGLYPYLLQRITHTTDISVCIINYYVDGTNAFQS